MFDLKRLCESQIRNNYSTTDLFFIGSQYDVEGLGEYVEMMYSPVLDRIDASNTECSYEEGQVSFKVSSNSYSRSLVLTEELIGALREGDYQYDNSIEFTQGSDNNILYYVISSTKVTLNK